MPRTRKRSRDVKKGHIKFVSVSAKTIDRYRVGVKRFFSWMSRERIPMPNSFDELDHHAGEFIHFLYQDDRPLGWVTDFVSGMKRLYPKCRRKLETASAYMRNWQKATVRTRALPLSSEMVRGMAAVAIQKGQPQLALILLVGFAGLLRAGEMVELKWKDVTIYRPDLAVLVFAESKGAQRKGQAETVFIRDARIIQNLKQRKAMSGPDDYLYAGSYSELGSKIKALASFFGLVHANLTPHCIRRGGATWHFANHLSYDSTQRHGRWAHARTAQVYIDEAMAEAGTASIPEEGKARLELVVRVLLNLMLLSSRRIDIFYYVFYMYMYIYIFVNIYI